MKKPEINKLNEKFEKAIEHYLKNKDFEKVIEIQTKYLNYYKEENRIIWDWLMNYL